MTRITTAGQTDVQALIDHGVLRGRLRHNPILAFIDDGDGITVRLFNKAADILALPDETPLMVSWPGQYSSDMFQLTVGDVRASVEADR